MHASNRMGIGFVVACAIGLAGCAGQTHFIDRSYNGTELASSRLAILPVSAPQIDLASPEDYADDFEDAIGEPGEKLAALVNSEFLEAFKRGVKANVNQQPIAIIPPGATDSRKVTGSFNKGKDIFEARVPTLEYLKEQNIQTDFALIVERVVFGRNTSTSTMHRTSAAPVMTPGGGMAAGGMTTVTTSHKSLDVEVHYVLYDYRQDRPAAYGVAIGQSTFNFVMTRDNWDKAARHAAKQVMKNLPFKRGGSI